jgi:hypothetical protein
MTALSRPGVSLSLLAAVLCCGCGPQGEASIGGEDELGESAAGLSLAPASAQQILALVNSPGTDFGVLDRSVGLDSRAAKNVIAARNGADGLCPSGDDVIFTTIAQLDAVPYVGDSAFAKLLAWAQAHPAPAGETVEGVSFQGWEAEVVVWKVNTATQTFLDGLLDARSAQNLVAHRPYATVSQMGPIAWVGPSALERLRREAASWWRERSAPGPLATLAEVKAALEAATAGLLMPSETDARFVFLQGQPLGGAPITVEVVRAQLTAQHDALISTVMYTDPSERSLAAKTQVEERTVADFLGNIINNADPNDPASQATAQRLATFKSVLQSRLTDVKVYRFGRISISTFFVGRAPTGELVALLTGQVET